MRVARACGARCRAAVSEEWIHGRYRDAVCRAKAIGCALASILDWENGPGLPFTGQLHFSEEQPSLSVERK